MKIEQIKKGATGLFTLSDNLNTGLNSLEGSHGFTVIEVKSNEFVIRLENNRKLHCQYPKNSRVPEFSDRGARDYQVAEKTENGFVREYITEYTQDYSNPFFAGKKWFIKTEFDFNPRKVAYYTDEFTGEKRPVFNPF